MVRVCADACAASANARAAAHRTTRTLLPMLLSRKATRADATNAPRPRPAAGPGPEGPAAPPLPKAAPPLAARAPSMTRTLPLAARHGAARLLPAEESRRMRRIALPHALAALLALGVPA